MTFASMNEAPRITRARLKMIDAESAEVGDGTTSAPTEEERLWLDILKSTLPENEKLKKKLSVCALADVVAYSNDAVTIEYDEKKYTINKPNNSLRIARAREYSIMGAVEELNNQRCITVAGVAIPKDFSGIDVEVLHLFADVAENFFFTPFL
jgi:hypothetical protein